MTHVVDSLVDRIMELDRFIEVDNQATMNIVDEQRNINTKRMTDGHVRLFRTFLESKNENRQIEDVPPADLDLYLAQFFLGVRKAAPFDRRDLTDVARQYEPTTLAAMHSSIHRYLSDKHYQANIKDNDRFKHSRDVLCAKMKELKKLGKGNKPNAAEPFSPDEIRTFVEQHMLGAGQ